MIIKLYFMQRTKSSAGKKIQPAEIPPAVSDRYGQLNCYQGTVIGKLRGDAEDLQRISNGDLLIKIDIAYL